MARQLLAYPIGSRILAVVLLITGTVKAHGVLTGADLSWTSAVISGFEISLGAWLILGLYPVWTRVVTLVFFVALLNVAISWVVEGRASCGCLGKVHLKPWYAVVFDAVAVMWLIASYHTSGQVLRDRRTRLASFAVLSGVVCLTLFGRTISRTNSEPSERVRPAADQELIARALAGIDANQRPLRTARYTMERTITHPGLRQVERRESRGFENGTRIISKRHPVLRHTFACALRGTDCRREDVGGRRPGRLQTVFGSHSVDYVPEINQAWIGDGPSPAGAREPLDPFCLALQKPVLNLPDWFRVTRISGAKEYEDELGAGVQVTGNIWNNGETTVRFTASRSYLPVSVELRHPDGSFDSVADLSYARLPNVGSWFPQRVVIRNWPGGTATTAVPPASVIEYDLKVAALQVNQDIPDDQFNIQLPKDCVVSDTRGHTPPRELGAGGATLSTVLAGPPLTGQKRSVWPYLVGLNIAVLAAALYCRWRFFDPIELHQ
jgi:hypothetical protein